MVKMVTQHGKKLAAGLSMTHVGQYLMLEVFNVKHEPISLQLRRQLPRQLQRQQPRKLPRQLPRQLRRQLPRLRLTPTLIAFVK